MAESVQDVDVQGEQLVLLPETPPKPKAKRIKLDDLPPVHVKPVPEWLPGMMHVGVFQSIAVIAREDGGYRMADGRRRVATARLARERGGSIDDVPALVFPAGTPVSVAAAITLMANLQRAPNPANELEAIEQMMELFSKVVDGVT
jgi:hypothetical protein